MYICIYTHTRVLIHVLYSHVIMSCYINLYDYQYYKHCMYACMYMYVYIYIHTYTYA